MPSLYPPPEVQERWCHWLSQVFYNTEVEVKVEARQSSRSDYEHVPLSARDGCIDLTVSNSMLESVLTTSQLWTQGVCPSQAEGVCADKVAGDVRRSPHTTKNLCASHRVESWKMRRIIRPMCGVFVYFTYRILGHCTCVRGV